MNFRLLCCIGRLSALVGAAVTLTCGADRITIAGSTTIQPIVDTAAKLYMERNPGVEIVVDGGGSGKGIKAVANGDVQIGMSSRALDSGELENGHLVPHKIGMDGVVFLVNTANSVVNLTRQQIQDIYAGKITNWSAVGGQNAPIVLYTLNSHHGTNEVFLNYFGLEAMESGAGPAMSATHRKRGDKPWSQVASHVIDDHQQVLAAVQANPDGIGYASIGLAMAAVLNGAHGRPLDLGGVSPMVAFVETGEYPFSRPLLIVTRGEPKGAVLKFLDFLCGPEGQKIVEKLDYIPAAAK
jgi:phosphate transport system substrate-binding protein